MLLSFFTLDTLFLIALFSCFEWIERRDSSEIYVYSVITGLSLLSWIVMLIHLIG